MLMPRKVMLSHSASKACGGVPIRRIMLIRFPALKPRRKGRRWAEGSKQRLAFALLLYTGQRGSDVRKMVRTDIAEPQSAWPNNRMLGQKNRMSGQKKKSQQRLALPELSRQDSRHPPRTTVPSRAVARHRSA